MLGTSWHSAGCSAPRDTSDAFVRMLHLSAKWQTWGGGEHRLSLPVVSPSLQRPGFRHRFTCKGQECNGPDLFLIATKHPERFYQYTSNETDHKEHVHPQAMLCAFPQSSPQMAPAAGSSRRSQQCGWSSRVGMDVGSEPCAPGGECQHTPLAVLHAVLPGVQPTLLTSCCLP